MRRNYFIAVICLFILASCTDETQNDDVLSQPPYKQLTDSIAQSPSDAGLYYRRGTLLYTNNQPAYAAMDIRKAWELDPREEYALRMTTVLKQISPDSAIVFLQGAVQKLPGSIALQIGLARGYQQQGRGDAALAICDAIIRQYPNQLDALALRSELLKAQDKDPDALATLEKAHALAPNDVELTHQLAFEYAEAGNPKVLRLTDSLIKADVRGSHAEPYYFKGVYFSNTGNQQEALKQFDAAIQRNYYFINAYINKGIVFFEQKKYAQALKVFDLASTVSPTEADPYYWLAKTQEAMGNKAEAKLNYGRAYGLDKTMAEAKAGMERL